MPAYIVDTKLFRIENKYPDSCYASYAMSDNYAWEPENRYKMLHNEDAAFEYWYEHVESTGKFYEGLGVCEDTKYDMFKDWLEG